MASGAGLRPAAENVDAPRAQEFYRRSLGVPWLIALGAIPLLIAVIGAGGLDRPRSVSGPAGPVPTLAAPTAVAAANTSLSPFSIIRSGNDITVSGDLPDDSAKAALMKSLTGSLPPGINVTDQVHINPNTHALDFSKSAPIFADSASISDFTLTVSQDVIILTGTATSQDCKSAVEGDVKHVWSNLNVVDNLVVNASSPPASAAAGSSCTDLQTAINVATGGPITFDNDGFSLTPVDQQVLTRVAAELKACPRAHAAINGYTDNSAADKVTVASSSQRAQKVADFLLALGVAGDQLAVNGLGSVHPVAPNGTAEGQAKNRRVEIVVS
ncbi:channel-forming protein ArfA/OmpATb [Mycobacterium parmense]|uniref:Peptidoglycan-binding protein ArfA n=1 Tax=Mycobacterium parmense TaxID=185642 RepID=A0A7I7Z2H8_9MYCO|nr:OmpA family protein [Mycobacterium parmense]MCV7352415.1 OmpA family protein [Mycobacterium parmense]ORW56371.1 hypothetical protein AWC20_16915 [Mycobacterium parmense]BBZ47862.1 peptidoglycan-binding protein ArfA [Mycobacterium parmense]